MNLPLAPLKAKKIPEDLRRVRNVEPVFLFSLTLLGYFVYPKRVLEQRPYTPNLIHLQNLGQYSSASVCGETQTEEDRRDKKLSSLPDVGSTLQP